ncbi:MAG: glycosyltransferase [Verrucomicrobia bacterium]|nr:glycosyltransferase [Verrucomicrobiota bacterium]
MNRTLHLYDLVAPDRPRWIPGDQYPRALVRAALRPWRGRPPGGLAKVTQNLCLGLAKIGQPYQLHSRPTLFPADGAVGILHGPIDQVRIVASARRCVTGVGILGFPDEWPTLFQDTRAAFHLQACDWAADYYRPVYGDRLRLWPVGIDTEACAPKRDTPKEFDLLVYNKLRWPAEHPEPNVRDTVLEKLRARGLRIFEIGYGRYPKGRENSFHALLARSHAMLFLCENETQGIAYNEALSMGVPILAWNPGRWLDPNRHAHGHSNAPASSVPYWDERCGEQFVRLAEFDAALDRFLEKSRAGRYAPRDYILENLTLEKCARHYVALLDEAAQTP